MQHVGVVRLPCDRGIGCTPFELAFSAAESETEVVTWLSRSVTIALRSKTSGLPTVLRQDYLASN